MPLFHLFFYLSHKIRRNVTVRALTSFHRIYFSFRIADNFRSFVYSLVLSRLPSYESPSSWSSFKARVPFLPFSFLRYLLYSFLLSFRYRLSSLHPLSPSCAYSSLLYFLPSFFPSPGPIYTHSPLSLHDFLNSYFCVSLFAFLLNSLLPLFSTSSLLPVFVSFTRFPSSPPPSLPLSLTE